MHFDVTPTPLSSGGSNDFDFVAPFTFGADIRGVLNGQEVFAREFTGQGFVVVNYEGTLRPGIFAAADESITYEFARSQTPEPGTLLLVGTAVVALARRSRR